MSEQEKRSLGVMCEAANRMCDFQLGAFITYGETMAAFNLLGMGEAKAGNKERAESERGEQDEKPERA